MLNSALLHDAHGQPLLESSLTGSREWAEVNAFCHRVYMPLATRPLVKGADPDSTLRTLKVGQVVFSRFCFGVPTRADDFDPNSGNIIVINTLKGGVRHPLGDTNSVDTKQGDSYVVDCSRTDYWNVADGQDLQLNLTIPHDLMEETAQRWYGFIPDDRLWKSRLLFGKEHSAWLALLDYATRSIDARNNRIENPLIEKRIEETICLELLRNWAGNADMNLENGARGAAPRYVREAERLIMEQADMAPTIMDIAGQLQISARSLFDGFRRFRGVTPHEYLTACRLDRVHEALKSAVVGETLTSIAAAKGYVNLHAMAQSYQLRFGESPYQTLKNRPIKL